MTGMMPTPTMVREALLAAFSFETLVRLLSAIVGGAVLGYERERHGRAAGFRTTTLVCFASCLLVMISKYAFEKGSFDSARVAAAIVSGMGFLGAGVIIRHSDHAVQGVTTAATLWVAMAIGMAFGAGGAFVWIGYIATAFAYVVLTLFNLLERWIVTNKYADLALVFDHDATGIGAIERIIEDVPAKVVGIQYGTREEGTLRDVVFVVRFRSRRIERISVPLTERLAALPGVLSVKWRG